MNAKLNKAIREVTIYYDASNRQYCNQISYCIAGVILTDCEKGSLDNEVDRLKRNTFQKPELVELKGKFISEKKGEFGKLDPERMELFLKKLSRLIFDVLRLKIIPLYTSRLENLSYTLPRLIKNQKNENREILPYFFFLSQYNNFLEENRMTGKIIFDQGDNNFKKLLKEQKEQEPFRVFDLCTRINMTVDEIQTCTQDSRQNNAIQIADLYAYTIRQSYVLTSAEILRRIKPGIKSRKYFPLPIERLKESYVKNPDNWVLKVQTKSM